MSRIFLDGSWELSFTLPESDKKINTSVDIPSNIEPTLVKLGLIEDYMPADNPYATQAFEAVDDWTYVKRFDHALSPEGYTEELVFEGIDTVAEIYYGRSYADAPDVDGRVYFKSKTRVMPGEFVSVKITEAIDYDLIGERI